ncbi:uncharacterized protein LOC144593241 [Rhinoraja longicauda]
MSFWASSSANTSGGVKPHDLTTKSNLTNLYNQPVVQAERVQRPLNGKSFMAGPFRHEGVRVQTEDGRSMLIHKGNDFGHSHQTVVVDAKHMSNSWQVAEQRPVEGRNVSDFVKAGGRDYNLVRSNCQDAADDMMNLTK